MAQCDFLPFATAANANVTPQATWAGSSTVSTGFVSGYAKSADANKAIRQGSFAGAGLSQWINQELVSVPILDDGNLNEYVTNLDNALRKLISSYIRVKASGTYNVYVSTASGNDSNDGLTPGTAFKTIQHGINYMLSNVDLGPYAAQVNIEAGTYNESLAVNTTPMGSNGAIFLCTYNGQVAITGVYGTVLTAQGGAVVVIAGNFLMSCSSVLNYANGVILAVGGALIASDPRMNLTIGNSPGCVQFFADRSGVIFFGYGYTIAGGANSHYYASFNGSIIMSQADTTKTMPITLQNTPNFAQQFCVAHSGGAVYVYSGCTYSGTSATGSRYTAVLNGVINVAGRGASFLPGDSAGTLSTGGQYG
jgi:hypothetical protein